MLNTPRIPIHRKLAIIYAALMLALVAVTSLAFVTLERLGETAERVATRYSPQLDKISDAQMLMFRISLEARHAMLVDTPAKRDETFARIGEFRKEMLAKLDVVESNLTTAGGRERFARIREADKEFWRLAGEVAGKIQAGDVPAAFAQLERELVPARDVMVGHIAAQRQWQQKLVLDAVTTAQAEAASQQRTVVAVAITASVFAAWLAWSLSRMMRGAFARAQTVTQRIAGGNLTGEIYVKKGDEFGHLFESIADMQQRLMGVVGRVRSVAEEIVQAAQAIDEANRELGAASQTHAESVRATTDSTQRMTDAVRESAQSVETVHRLASEAADVAARGGSVVGEVVTTMRGIDQSSKRIAEIVGVIDGIAFQTNILALNAAVEAARAGEQGRGFAVVAGEVRALAQRSASAAREVRALIDDSLERIGSGAALADQAGQTMHSIVGSVTQVTQLVDGVTHATRAQRAGVDAVHGAVDHIGAATTRSLDAVARSAAASAALRAHAQALESAVSAFNLSAT